MPYCPNCQTEYESSLAYCPACQVQLVDTLPQPEIVDGAGGFGFVELAEFTNVSEAEMIQELLEKNGVRTVLRGEIDPIGVASGAAPTALLVEERDLLRGRELYDAYYAGAGVEEAQSDLGQ